MKALHRIEVKLFLLILFIGIVFTGVFFTLQNKEKEEMEILTKDSERGLQQLTEKVVQLHGQSLETHTFDYSYWDEMIEFVKTQSPKWAEDNIVSGLETFGTNVMWVYDTKFALKYAHSKNNQNDLLQLNLSDYELAQIFQQNWFPHFYKKTNRGVLEIRGAPIQPSSDRERLTRPQGYLLEAKLWDDTYIEELTQSTGTKVSLIDPAIHEKLNEMKKDDNQFVVYYSRFLKDHLGNNISVLHVEKKSELISILQYSTYRKFIVLLINAIVLLVVISFVLFYQVIKPINVLSKSLSFSDPTVLDPMGRTKGEFGSLAKLIQEFFKQREELEIEITERKKAQSDLQVLNSELEQRVKDRTLEIKQERDQAKRYLDIAGSIITILDEDGNISLINKKGYEILGYNSTELIGFNWFRTLYNFDVREKALQKYRAILRNENSANEFHIDEVLTKSGQKKVLMFQNTVLQDEKNNNIGVIFSAQDITELKQKEKELIVAKEKAEESNRLKSSFLANMSHELRTPMIGILGYSELLLAESTDQSTQEMIREVHASGTRLLETLNLVLDLSRLEANKQELKLENVNINNLMMQLHTSFLGAAKTKGLMFNCKLPQNMLYAIIDKRLLIDVMNNLINNALKFTTAGYVEIELRVFKNNFKIMVRDSGVGIPKDSLQLIFEEFRQASEGLNRKFQGSGLGLTISRKYIELLGGKIDVNSEEGYGAEFIIDLPYQNDLMNSNTLDNNPTDAIIKSKLNCIQQENLPNILIVEDDNVTRRVIYSYLKNDYNLVLSSNADEALASIENNSFDAILMDINLGPGMSGLELTKAIKARMNGHTAPIIASTAFAMNGDKEEFLAAGCDYYISKPFSRSELHEILRKVISFKEA